MIRLLFLLITGVSLLGVADRENFLKTMHSVEALVSANSPAHYCAVVFLAYLLLLATGSAVFFLYDFAGKRKLNLFQLRSFFFLTGLLHMLLGNYAGGMFSMILTITVSVLKGV